tara:strand:+ start:2267 stop:3139 length:873 start_codon:yes stop_codon:yes gene_type:complete
MSDTSKIGYRVGFIETIDDTLKIYRHCLNSDEYTFEEKMSQRDAVEHIKNCDLYYMGEEFNDMLTEWGDQYHDILHSESRFSKFTRPPSRLCYIRVDIPEIKSGTVPNSGYLTTYYEDGMTSITLVSPVLPPTKIGSYHPDKGTFFHSDQEIDNWDEEKMKYMSNTILAIAGSFELINNPRFIVSETAGTRAQRKQMKREQNIPLEAWHKITWNVDESTVFVNENERGGWNMPLHYTRGHPRKAEPHHKNLMYKNGKPYKWIEGFWSGHPAFGIKKGYHAPKIGESDGKV